MWMAAAVLISVPQALETGGGEPINSTQTQCNVLVTSVYLPWVSISWSSQKDRWTTREAECWLSRLVFEPCPEDLWWRMLTTILWKCRGVGGCKMHFKHSWHFLVLLDLKLKGEYQILLSADKFWLIKDIHSFCRQFLPLVFWGFLLPILECCSPGCLAAAAACILIKRVLRKAIFYALEMWCDYCHAVSGLWSHVFYGLQDAAPWQTHAKSSVPRCDTAWATVPGSSCNTLNVRREGHLVHATDLSLLGYAIQWRASYRNIMA